MRGDAEIVVAELSDYDVDRIEGQTDKLIGLLQEKYGYARAQAEQGSSGDSRSGTTKWGGRSPN